MNRWMMRNRKVFGYAGFSLIELMIVITIIGILAAIAIPSYNTHVIKSRVSEMLSLAARPKAVVTENVATNALTSLSGVSASVLGAGFTNPNTIGHVTSMTIGTSGVVTLQGDASTGNTSITLTPRYNTGGLISWSCNAVPDTYAPATCP